MPRTGLDALFAGLVAAGVTALLTPLTSRIARRIGAVDEPRERGLSDRPTPRLGGLAIYVGVVVPLLIWLPSAGPWKAVLIGGAVITLVGAVDDVLDLPAGVKLAGQIGAAWIVARDHQARVQTFTLPLIHRVDLGHWAVPLTILGLVVIMNAVNFSDGVDGLASGVCAIAGASFALIAFDAGYTKAGVLSAITAGVAAGFLLHNFYPASAFMGDSGSNLLGLLLGSVAVLGAVKTSAFIALFLPLIVLAVPFVDTTFVVLKRMKYRRPVYRADTNHLHHRFSRIGFSQRRTVLYLYAWTLMLGGVAVATRFVPYSDHHGHFHTGWSVVMALILVAGVAASVYLVYLLEILKLRRRFRRESREEVEKRLETGEFEAVGRR
jgi:UDP-GlcNAc:undecaprenyl-phosphate/decaprenyl-phosphate GlcNAc-1-phosphate transferase